MTIRTDHVEAAKRGEAVRLEADQVPLVLVRADIYERMRESFDPRDAYPLVNEVMREDDAEDPLLAAYQ
jgi:hypothetical protein